MPTYNLRIQVLSFCEDDDTIWDMLRVFEKQISDAGLQLNFLILEKNGNEYPKSAKELEQYQTTQRLLRTQRAVTRLQLAQHELKKAEEALDQQHNGEDTND